MSRRSDESLLLGEPLVEPGKQHPLCEGCARRKVEIHDERGWPVPAMFREESYWRRAYVEPALDEEKRMQQTESDRDDARGIYGLTRSGGHVWHLLYEEEEDQPALCGIGALRRQVWASITDTLPEGDLVCANCTRVDKCGNRRDQEPIIS